MCARWRRRRGPSASTRSGRLRADAYVKPNDGDAKVFIIPEASRMTPQAQNALLKVLEQPPTA